MDDRRLGPFIGKAIKGRMEERGIGLAELARKADFLHSTIEQILAFGSPHPDRRPIGEGDLGRIADALGTTWSEIEHAARILAENEETS